MRYITLTLSSPCIPMVEKVDLESIQCKFESYQGHLITLKYMEWKKHPIFDNYEASLNGEVRNQSKKIIKTKSLQTYHSVVTLWKNGKRKFMVTSKFVYECFYGLIPKELVVMHHDEYLPEFCINATFNLFLGTRSINQKDAYQKGRMLPTRGEKSGRSYLSQEQVDNIRKMRYDGCTYAQIISVYKIPKSTLSNIINHKTWA